MSEFNLGINENTNAEGNTLMLPPKKVEGNPTFPSGWEFPVSKLVNVVDKPDYETKNGNKATLSFIFKDAEGRQYIHIEWEQDPTDAKFKEKVEWMNQRIAHIYLVTMGQHPGALGAGSKTFADFFKAVADAFNSKVFEKTVEGQEKPTKVKAYSLYPMYTKLTYYKTKLGFPLTPNFLERLNAKVPCKLTINPSEEVTPQKGAKPGMTPGGFDAGASAAASGEFPSFPTNFG